MKLTNNFNLDEFIESRFYDHNSQDRVWKSFYKDLTTLFPEISKLASQLQVLRDYVNKPVIINISYRPKWWELEKGRDGSSRHCLGMAADIVVEGMDALDVADVIEDLIHKGKMRQGGLGRYKTFTHYDTRGFKARWGE